MPILLPVAGVYISLILLACIGGGIGLLSGLFGVGGGFLLTPLLMMIGVPATVAAASVSCQMVASSSSGVAAHFRLGNVDIKIGSVLLIGGLAGGGLGVEAIKFLREVGEANLAIKITYIIVLGILGSYMFYESLRTLLRGSVENRERKTPSPNHWLARLPWQMDFPRSGVRHSILIPLILSFVAGILASVMGVGGGFIMLPLMIYMLGMPTHVAVGTSLFQILFMSAGVTFMQADANHTVDFLLVLPLALCSAVGAQFGARLSRLLRGEQLVILLATLVLAVTGEMTWSLFLRPSNLLKPAVIALKCDETAAVEQSSFVRSRSHSVVPVHQTFQPFEIVRHAPDSRNCSPAQTRRYRLSAYEDSERRVSRGNSDRPFRHQSETVGPGRSMLTVECTAFRRPERRLPGRDCA